MGRTLNPTAALTAPAVLGPNEARAVLEQAEAGGRALTAEGLAAEMLGRGSAALIEVGRIQMATALATVADSAIAECYDRLKESKGYLGMPYTDAEGQVRQVATLDEFCERFLGRSYRRCRELSANRRLLGDDLYHAAESAGFRQRDYNALKALPPGDQEAVQVAMAEDPQRALDLLTAIIARQQQAKEAAEARSRHLEEQTESLQADYDAASRRLGDTLTKLHRLESGGAVPQLDQQMASWPAVSGALIGEIRAHLTRIGLMIQEAERRITNNPPAEDTPEWDVVQRACRTWYDQAGPALAQLREEVGGVEVHLERIVGAFAFATPSATRRED